MESNADHIKRDVEEMDLTDLKLASLMDEIEDEVLDLEELTLEKLELETVKEGKKKDLSAVHPAHVASTKGDGVIRTTHDLGLPAPKVAAPLGIEGLKSGGNGTSKKKEPLYREITKKDTLVPLPDGALSVEADLVPKEERLFVFEWPTMIYVGYDIRGTEEQYEEYLVMYYKPEMRPQFGNKLAIHAPTSETQSN